MMTESLKNKPVPVKKNLLLHFIPLVLLLILSGYRADGPVPVKCSFTVIQDTEWRDLFDGQTLAGWKSVLEDHDPAEGWQIRDGNLVLAIPGSGGDLLTREKFSNFELVLEFNIAEGCNSGIKYFVDSFDYQGTISVVGLEFQLIDDQHAEDVTEPSHRMGALFDPIPPDPNKLVHPPGEWNALRILSHDGYVEQWLNDRKIVAFNRFSQDFKKRLAVSKYRNWKGFGQIPEGHILIQDHGSRVSFRNIKIRTWNRDE